MANWMKVEDKEKSMKRSEGSKEIRRKIDLTQKARAQKKTVANSSVSQMLE